jgi:hypothetical protein
MKTIKHYLFKHVFDVADWLFVIMFVVIFVFKIPGFPIKETPTVLAYGFWLSCGLYIGGRWVYYSLQYFQKRKKTYPSDSGIKQPFEDKWKNN